MSAVIRVEPAAPNIKSRKKVAAYARVSMESERMNHSLSAQVSYYSTLIQSNLDWQYAGVYVDEGISGTGIDKRDNFKRMINAADDGKIDVILTKSIQRFARNTVDLLETVRHLKDIGVEVRFEKENISSMSGDGELMLSILASFAQEESRSISENVKWSKSKSAEKGVMTNASAPYGYRCENGTLLVVPEKAEVVKRIFTDYTKNKMTVYQVTKRLNSDNIPSPRGSVWSQSVVSRLLRNVTYTGNMLFGKTYVENYLSHRRVWNHGERPRYYAEGTHEAIISAELFDETQEVLDKCGNLGRHANRGVEYHCFTGKIICGCCGKPFGRKLYTTKSKGDRYIWLCRNTPAKCQTAVLYERELEQMIADELGMRTFSAAEFENKISVISVEPNDMVRVTANNGSTVEFLYKRKRERK